MGDQTLKATFGDQRIGVRFIDEPVGHQKTENFCHSQAVFGYAIVRLIGHGTHSSWVIQELYPTSHGWLNAGNNTRR
jgi:hypothetical protein